MPERKLQNFWERPPEARPVLLEGRWLGGETDKSWAASDPASVLEGPDEILPQFPSWLDDQARKYPEGAAIGFLSYELARRFEAFPHMPVSALPDISFAYYPHLEDPVPQSPYGPHPAPGRQTCCNFDFETYRRAVESVRRYIAAGDIYQANLTVQFCVDVAGETPERIYARLRASGAPFRAFLKTPARTILSNSPERFFRVCQNRILTSPIKGTIARDRRDDESALNQLLSSSKDRAENVMIVDLLRNDLGRICHYGSVEAQLWQFAVLPQLIHLVSHVKGTLRPGVGLLEILRALFPCGSVTGAPKVRSMEILSVLENAPRGVSMGAIGIIRGIPGSAGCTMDFNVSIRTMMIENGKATFNVGGGIVTDSVPSSEYTEVLLKAQPLFHALGATLPLQE